MLTVKGHFLKGQSYLVCVCVCVCIIWDSWIGSLLLEILLSVEVPPGVELETRCTPKIVS